MVTYVERDSNSDLTPAWPNTSLFDKEMIEGAIAVSSFTPNFPVNSTRSGAFISIANKPNNDAMEDGGTQTVEFQVVSGGSMNVSGKCRIVRLDAAGNIEESGAFTSTQTLTNGSKTFSPVSPTWGSAGDAELCTDRLAIEFEFVNSDTMMSYNIEIGTNTIAHEVILDITEDGGTCGVAAQSKFINMGGADLD